MNRNALLKSFCSLLLIAVFETLSLSQLTVRITSLPANTPSGDTNLVLVVPCYECYSPDKYMYSFTKDTDNTYSVVLDINSPQFVPFIIRRGWHDKAEILNTGDCDQYIRSQYYSGSPKTYNVSVQYWRDIDGAQNHSAATNVITIDSFYMKSLDRYRPIRVYLPPDYDTSGRHYQVLYMQDGNFLFDKMPNWACAEWEVDESLNELFNEGDSGVIVVGIDADYAYRNNELAPWHFYDNCSFANGGEGDAYINFIIDSLKPYVDANFRTLPDRSNTGIMGSSLGGTVSAYGAIKHQDVFGKVGLLSPAFQFFPEAFDLVEATGKQFDTKFYLTAGHYEGDLRTYTSRMYDTLIMAGFDSSELMLQLPNYGQHGEAFYRGEFAKAYLWLFRDTLINPVITNVYNAILEDLSIYPTPVIENLTIKYNAISQKMREYSASIFDLSGRLIIQNKLNTDLLRNGENISLKGLKAGTYILKLQIGSEQMVRKIIKL